MLSTESLVWHVSFGNCGPYWIRISEWLIDVCPPMVNLSWVLLTIVDVIISGVIISIRPPGRPPLKKENIDRKPATRQWQELSGFLLTFLQNFLVTFWILCLQVPFLWFLVTGRWTICSLIFLLGVWAKCTWFCYKSAYAWLVLPFWKGNMITWSLNRDMEVEWEAVLNFWISPGEFDDDREELVRAIQSAVDFSGENFITTFLQEFFRLGRSNNNVLFD